MSTAAIDGTAPRVRSRLVVGVGAWGWALVRGLLLGATVGVAYRAWMRLISVHPEFTWDGTIFIIMLGVVAGLGASLTRTARVRLERRWARGAARTLGTVAVLGLGLGQGTIALPVWLFAGLAWGRTNVNRWGRIALLVLAGVATWLMFDTIGPDLRGLSVLRRALAVPTFLALAGMIAMLFTWPTRAAQPGAQHQ